MWWRVFFLVFVVFHCLVNDLNAKNLRFKREDLSHQDSFITEIERNCKCVLDYQCDEDGFIITDGAGLTDQRASSGDKRENIICKGGLYKGQIICCRQKLGEENKPPVTTENPVTDPVSPETSTVANMRTGTIGTIELVKAQRCGIPTSGTNQRVSSDDNSTPLDGEFPWLAAIYKQANPNAQWIYYKIGSLIHPRVILTGAHVVYNLKPNQLKVIVNSEIVLAQIGDNVTHERDVQEIVAHKNFSSGTLRNNVALLILQEPYDIVNSRINTVCLRPDELYENKTCYVAGWGAPNIKNAAPSLLKRVDLPAVSLSKCEKLLRPHVSPTFVFHQSLMCAGGEEGKDACEGDGGGPLVCPVKSNDAMYQAGIVTYGLECGQKDVPSVYADVGHQYGWIVERLKERNINI